MDIIKRNIYEKIITLKFLFQLFFIAPIGIDALDQEIFNKSLSLFTLFLPFTVASPNLLTEK
jgi:hypothetical protein